MLVGTKYWLGVVVSFLTLDTLKFMVVVQYMQVHKRVRLAIRLDGVQRQQTKEKAEHTWRKRSADEVRLPSLLGTWAQAKGLCSLTPLRILLAFLLPIWLCLDHGACIITNSIALHIALGFIPV